MDCQAAQGVPEGTAADPGPEDGDRASGRRSGGEDRGKRRRSKRLSDRGYHRRDVEGGNWERVNI